MVVFPLLLHRPPALWHVLVTILVVVCSIWPLLQKLSINPIRASATDPGARNTLNARSQSDPMISTDQAQEQ